MVNPSEKFEIMEVWKEDYEGRVFTYDYTTTEYYEMVLSHKENGWHAALYLSKLPGLTKKSFRGCFFADHIPEPRMFVARVDGEDVGWIELGFDAWNNRMRIWNLLVKQTHRGNGFGSLLVGKAVQVAKEKGARMMILETQSCNVPAIRFYLKLGFNLIGFDSVAYTNDDISRRDVRLEFGRSIIASELF